MAAVFVPVCGVSSNGQGQGRTARGLFRSSSGEETVRALSNVWLWASTGPRKKVLPQERGERLESGVGVQVPRAIIAQHKKHTPRPFPGALPCIGGLSQTLWLCGAVWGAGTLSYVDCWLLVVHAPLGADHLVSLSMRSPMHATRRMGLYMCTVGGVALPAPPSTARPDGLFVCCNTLQLGQAAATSAPWAHESERASTAKPSPCAASCPKQGAVAVVRQTMCALRGSPRLPAV